jgi:hypothetical protein
MDITIEEDLGAPFIKTLDDHRWDRDYNEVLNFNPTSRPAQRLVWASLRASLTREAALRARIEGLEKDKAELRQELHEAIYFPDDDSRTKEG